MLQDEQNRPPRKAYRVRHPLKIRTLTVNSIEKLGPNMLRFVFQSQDLSDFTSASFDDHVKVFFPDAQTGQLVLPQVTEQGIVFPTNEKPIMRDYTPRYFDQQRHRLTIDFALHEAGPATDWARQAKVGDAIGIGGPRGSMVIPMDFDGYLLIGDDTALPAIGRRLEELPAHAQVVVITEVDSVQDQMEWQTQAEMKTIWLQRMGEPAGQADLFLQALKHTPLPTGDFHTWIAAETNVARQIRKTLTEEHGINKAYIKAAGYWQLGKSDAHEVLAD